MADEIKAGSVVQLKSGGPKMTVEKVARPGMSGAEQHAWCDWFAQDAAPWTKDQGTYPLTSLRFIE